MDYLFLRIWRALHETNPSRPAAPAPKAGRRRGYAACLQPLSTLDLSLVVIDQFAMLAAVPKTIEYACMSN